MSLTEGMQALGGAFTQPITVLRQLVKSGDCEFSRDRIKTGELLTHELSTKVLVT